MDYEDFLIECYRPLHTIEILTDIMETKTNEEWDFIGGTPSRESGEELLCLNFAIKLCAKYLVDKRDIELKNIDCV